MPEFPFDRRKFLGGGAALLAAAAAERLSAGQSLAPLRVAVVGTGARGCDLIRALATIDSAEIVAVCDNYEPHLAHGAEFAGPQAKTYRDFARMLKDVRPAAVVVAAPLALHYEMCLAALDAGAAVFCEKLMCYSLDQARRLAAEVERRGAVFQVGLQRRANAVYRQAVAMVETGMLGEIVAIKCQWHRNNDWRRPIPVPRGDSRWAGLERQLNWRLYRDTSQGLMAELASHQIDVANEVLAGHPTRVLASGGIDHWRDGREVFDNVFCVYEYVVPRRGAVGPARSSSAQSGGVVQSPNAPSAGADPGSYTVRVSYSSIQNNAFEGASELILGTRGTLFLTTKKGLFYTEEQTAARPASTAGPASPAAAEQEAALVTSGKTLKMSNDPWAFRGKPFEIDVESDDTRDELVSFVHAAARGDRQTACSASAGLINAATILMANEALYSGGVAAWPADLA